MGGRIFAKNGSNIQVVPYDDCGLKIEKSVILEIWPPSPTPPQILFFLLVIKYDFWQPREEIRPQTRSLIFGTLIRTFKVKPGCILKFENRHSLTFLVLRNNDAHIYQKFLIISADANCEAENFAIDWMDFHNFQKNNDDFIFLN